MIIPHPLPELFEVKGHQNYGERVCHVEGQDQGAYSSLLILANLHDLTFSSLCL